MLSSTTSDTPVRGDVWIVNWPTTPCACAVQTSLREERRLSPEKHVTLRVCAGRRRPHRLPPRVTQGIGMPALATPTDVESHRQRHQP